MASTIKVNTIQNTCGADIIKESGNTITIGARAILLLLHQAHHKQVLVEQEL